MGWSHDPRGPGREATDGRGCLGSCHHSLGCGKEAAGGERIIELPPWFSRVWENSGSWEEHSGLELWFLGSGREAAATGEGGGMVLKARESSRRWGMEWGGAVDFRDIGKKWQLRGVNWDGDCSQGWGRDGEA